MKTNSIIECFRIESIIMVGMKYYPVVVIGFWKKQNHCKNPVIHQSGFLLGSQGPPARSGFWLDQLVKFIPKTNAAVGSVYIYIYTLNFVAMFTSSLITSLQLMYTSSSN